MNPHKFVHIICNCEYRVILRQLKYAPGQYYRPAPLLPPLFFAKVIFVDPHLGLSFDLGKINKSGTVNRHTPFISTPSRPDGLNSI